MFKARFYAEMILNRSQISATVLQTKFWQRQDVFMKSQELQNTGLCKTPGTVTDTDVAMGKP